MLNPETPTIPKSTPVLVLKVGLIEVQMGVSEIGYTKYLMTPHEGSYAPDIIAQLAIPPPRA